MFIHKGVVETAFLSSFLEVFGAAKQRKHLCFISSTLTANNKFTAGWIPTITEVTIAILVDDNVSNVVRSQGLLGSWPSCSHLKYSFSFSSNKPDFREKSEYELKPITAAVM